MSEEIYDLTNYDDDIASMTEDEIMDEVTEAESEAESEPEAEPQDETMTNSQQKRGICGLFNMGNTCYANAAIQMLRAIPEFSAFCNSHPAALHTAAPAGLTGPPWDRT
jgi:ubiquitin C-terminal hydrolase